MFEELLAGQGHDDLAIRVMVELHGTPSRPHVRRQLLTTSGPTHPVLDHNNGLLPWKGRLGECARTVMTADKSSLS
jgi:hypothetical protein